MTQAILTQPAFKACKGRVLLTSLGLAETSTNRLVPLLSADTMRHGIPSPTLKISFSVGTSWKQETANDLLSFHSLQVTAGITSEMELYLYTCQIWTQMAISTEANSNTVTVNYHSQSDMYANSLTPPSTPNSLIHKHYTIHNTHIYIHHIYNQWYTLIQSLIHLSLWVWILY